MTLRSVRAVMLFVDHPPTAARWYADLFDVDVVVQDDFAYLDTGSVELAFHPSDSIKNPAGRSSVVYWAVDSVADERARLVAHGATALRGPLVIDAMRTICQLVDPFGHVIGLDGPP